MEKRIFGIEVQVWATLSCFAAVLLVMFAPEFAWAQQGAGAELVNKVKTIRTYVYTIAGVGIGISGIAAAILFYTGSERAWGFTKKVIIGAIILSVGTELLIMLTGIGDASMK